MKIWRVHVAWDDRLWPIPGNQVRRRSELVSPARRQLEVGVTVSKPCEIGGEVEQLLCDQMDNLTFALEFCR